MSHPKNKVMERMTPLERWNGLAWVCTKGYGKVLLDVVEGCSGTTVFPQTQRVRLVRLSLFGCDLTTSISSPGNPRTSPGKSARAHKQTTAQATIQEVLHKPMFRAKKFVTCSRTHQGMDTDGLEELGFIQKKSPKKPINRMCPGKESTDEPKQSDISTTGQRQTAMGLQTRDRVLMSSPHGQAVRSS